MMKPNNYNIVIADIKWLKWPDISKMNMLDTELSALVVRSNISAQSSFMDMNLSQCLT